MPIIPASQEAEIEISLGKKFNKTPISTNKLFIVVHTNSNYVGGKGRMIMIQGQPIYRAKKNTRH
jgi:hypothetical protein